MTETAPSLTRLRFTENTAIPGLATAERRVSTPQGTLVCVHGGLDRAASFSRVARRIEELDVVAYDRRGYQGSRALGPSDVSGHVDDLLQVIDHERRSTGRPVAVLGHSFGGVVAIAAAIAEPDVISAVVAYESPAPWIKNRPSARPPLSDDAGAEVERFFRRVVSNGAWERLSEPERDSRRADGPALLADLEQLADIRPLYELEKLRVPTTYAYGDGVLVEYYTQLAAEMSKRNPIVHVRTIDHAGHGAHLSSPDKLTEVIRSTWETWCM